MTTGQNPHLPSIPCPKEPFAAVDLRSVSVRFDPVRSGSLLGCAGMVVHKPLHRLPGSVWRSRLPGWAIDENNLRTVTFPIAALLHVYAE